MLVWVVTIERTGNGSTETQVVCVQPTLARAIDYVDEWSDANLATAEMAQNMRDYKATKSTNHGCETLRATAFQMDA